MISPLAQSSAPVSACTYNDCYDYSEYDQERITLFSAETICVLAVETDKQTPLRLGFISVNAGALFFSVDILNSSC